MNAWDYFTSAAKELGSAAADIIGAYKSGDKPDNKPVTKTTGAALPVWLIPLGVVAVVVVVLILVLRK